MEIKVGPASEVENSCLREAMSHEEAIKNVFTVGNSSDGEKRGSEQTFGNLDI